MPYSKQLAIDFWSEFDDVFLWKARSYPEVMAAYNEIGQAGLAMEKAVDLFRGCYTGGTFPVAFNSKVQEARNGFLALSRIQLEVMDKHFPSANDLRKAFEDFGQGVLFDPQRVQTKKFGSLIHMMDGTPDDWVGYHRWHAYGRAGLACGADPRWNAILKLMTLAWSIQTEANPTIDSQDNPGLTEARLVLHRHRWLNASDDDIDHVFANYRTLAPSIGPAAAPIGVHAFAVESENAILNFARVRQLLEDAAGGGSPIHQGKRRFWNVALAEFLQLEIYGVKVVAEPGANRGERSGLIQALRGTGPFGEGGMPRMPRNGPPMPDTQIALISQWIDSGCPGDA